MYQGFVLFFQIGGFVISPVYLNASVDGAIPIVITIAPIVKAVIFVLNRYGKIKRRFLWAVLSHFLYMSDTSLRSYAQIIKGFYDYILLCR